MRKDLSNYRKNYTKGALVESNLPEDPLQLFQQWFEIVDANKKVEANAMTLSTIGLDGFPKGRVVLLKGFDHDGFLFYTNYGSEKGESIAGNKNVSLSFFWPTEERQVIIKGVAEKTTEEVSDTYFRSRPRGSQLSAYVSDQSRNIESREVLEQKLNEAEVKFDGLEVPRPVEWGGYVVKPVEIEFWQGRDNRLHDRIRYVKNDSNNSWTTERLSP